MNAIYILWGLSITIVIINIFYWVWGEVLKYVLPILFISLFVIGLFIWVIEMIWT